MAASLITRTGFASALAKLKPAQPLAKCFGSFVMRPLRTGAGKPIETTSNFPPRTVSLSSAIIFFRPHPRPGGKSSVITGRLEQFHLCAADIDDENLSLHERPPLLAVMLSGQADRPFEAAKETLGLRFCRRAGRPAFHDLKRDKTEQRQTGKFQIEPQILCNLLDRSDSIELRSELRLLRGQLQILDPLKALFRVSRYRHRVEVYMFAEILNETQTFQCPIIDVWLCRHVARVTQ